MKDKNIPITELEEQSKKLDKLLFKRGDIRKSVDAHVFGLTKVDGGKVEDSDSDVEALDDADLIFPNYLLGEDGKVLDGLNLNIEPAKHMQDLVRTKVNFASYSLRETASAITVPNYMKKQKRPPKSDIEMSNYLKDHDENAQIRNVTVLTQPSIVTGEKGITTPVSSDRPEPIYHKKTKSDGGNSRNQIKFSQTQ